MKVKNILIVIFLVIVVLYSWYIFIFQTKIDKNAKNSYSKNIDIFYRKALKSNIAAPVISKDLSALVMYT